MLVEPRDPLIARDGRPFTVSPGTRARSQAFPLPQTLAGALRTEVGLGRGLRFPEDAEAVRSVGIQGPLLAEHRDRAWLLMVPAPADALLLEPDGRPRLYRLRPLALRDGMGVNLPQGLHPVGIPGLEARGKPLSLPRFWYWPRFASWLLRPEDVLADEDLGHDGPTHEVRTHVSIGDTRTAQEGMLFETSGLEFVRLGKGLSSARRLALVVWSEERLGGLQPLGGERRLARWAAEGPAKPRPPQGLLGRLLRDRAARVILLTPSAFERAFLPRDGTVRRAQVEAVVMSRPVVVSGWDLQLGRPKPSRRLVPAGSVYFVRFPGWGEQRIAGWLGEVWMENLADEPQDRLDGYGLAAVGTWSGEFAEVGVSDA